MAKRRTKKQEAAEVIHGERVVAIVNYNTPEMTEAAILSVKKHGGENYQYVVFDNSDARPFTKTMDGVTVLDNTKGQIIDLDAEIRKFKDRSYEVGCPEQSVFGSMKHTMTIQKLWNILPDGFLLMDSDVLVKENVDFMFWKDYCVVAHVQNPQPHNLFKIGRVLPLLMYVNVPLCRAARLRYFDPARTMGLLAGGMRNRNNWYDTGASFFEDIRQQNICRGRRIDIRPLMIHFKAGSWRKGLQEQMEWLRANKSLWMPDGDDYKLGGHKQFANKNAKIYICAHADFVKPVSNEVYEVADARKDGDSWNNIPGAYFSELLQMKRVSVHKDLKNIIGFCGYRKYFAWMDHLPDLADMVKRHGCIVSRYYTRLGGTVREQYARMVGNVEDLDAVTAIIDERYPDFAPAWRKSLDSRHLHPASMFVMKRKDFQAMTDTAWDVVTELAKRLGDIDAHILSNPEKYHLKSHGYESRLEYQRRLGGQMCERIVSAWIDWQFPEAKEVAMVLTQKPVQ